MARCAGLSRAHFSSEFKRAFGESPHEYLLTRRLERAAALLRTTDYSVADICMEVGLSSVGSFTTSFRRMFGRSPTAYRAAFPPAANLALIPACVLRAYGRPQNRTFREDGREGHFVASDNRSNNAHRGAVPMIKIGTTQLWVHDQNEALEFYTKKLGWQVRADVTVPEMGNFRWLAVSPAEQPDIAVVLMAIPGAPVMDSSTAAQVRGLMAKGFAGTIFLTTDDCQRAYEELSRPRRRVHGEARRAAVRTGLRLPRSVGQQHPNGPAPPDRRRQLRRSARDRSLALRTGLRLRASRRRERRPCLPRAPSRRTHGAPPTPAAAGSRACSRRSTRASRGAP